MADSKTSSSKSTNPKPQTKANPTPFIDAGTAYDAYDESKRWLRPYFDPIDEFERIARNKPSDQIPDELPKLTDGTMAAIVQEQPKRIIQQVPSGMTTCKDYPGYAQIADIVLFEQLIPMYNRMGDMLQKSWNMVGKAMTWGRSASYTFFTNTNGIMHTDFVIPYAKDVLSEKGKVFAPDSNIGFLRSWYQKRDLQAIITREEYLEKTIKGYKSDWDLNMLKAFMNTTPAAKPANLQTPAEKEKGDGNSGGYEVIHCFQNGLGAEFYSVAPQMAGAKDAKGGAGVLRTKVNKDPRGKMPLDFLYCNIDLSNPMGRGQVELSGGVQNLIDQQMQMFQFITTLMMGPPLQVWGDVNKASLKFVPNAIWNMGTNPNTSLVKPYDVNNSAIQNFPNNYGLLKSQIMNLNSTQDHSISSSDGNPMQSKTQAGVQAAESRLGVSDNYLRKQYETWFEAQSETSINVYFAEMTGTKKIRLDADQLRDIERSEAKKYVDKQGILTVPYKDINDVTFKFKVDASTSEIKENQDNAEKLTEVLKLMQQSQDPSILQKIPAVTKLIIDEIGAEGTDDLFPELQKDANGQPMQPQQAQPAGPSPQEIVQLVQQTVQQAMQQQQQQDPSQHPIIKLMETLQIKFESLPADAQQQVLAMIGINSQMPSPSATALDQKQQDLNIKAAAQAQNADTNATKTALDVAKTAHDHTIAMHNAAQAASQPQQQPGQPQNAQSTAQTTQNQPAASQQPPQGAAPALDAALSPDEEQVVQALLHRGFNEADAEQAIVMMRQGMSSDQVMQTLGAKYARQ